MFQGEIFKVKWESNPRPCEVTVLTRGASVVPLVRNMLIIISACTIITVGNFSLEFTAMKASNHILHQHSLSSGLLSPPLSSLCRRCLSPESPSPRSGVASCACAGASSLQSARWHPKPPPPPPASAASWWRCRGCGRAASGTPSRRRRRCGRRMPRPAGGRARSGGWCSSLVRCLPHVCPSSLRTCQGPGDWIPRRLWKALAEILSEWSGS